MLIRPTARGSGRIAVVRGSIRFGSRITGFLAVAAIAQ